MVLNDDVKAVIAQSAFAVIVTTCPDGTPHPIVVGKAEPCGEDNLSVGVYKMEVTQKNLAANPNAQVVVSMMDGGPKGFRLYGTAVVKDKQFLFTATRADVLF